jgi:hypothetical protein
MHYIVMSKYISDIYLSNVDPKQLMKNYTVCKNEKKTIFKKFQDSLKRKNIENAEKYALELHCSGYFDLIYRKMLNIYIENINIVQPQGLDIIYKFSEYYNSKYTFKIKKEHPLYLVNDQVIRNIIFYMISMIATSNERKILKLKKIDLEDFNLSNKKKSLISKNLNLVKNFLTGGDPKEIIVPLSEICNHFEKKKEGSHHKIIYWLSWLFDYEKQYHKNNLQIGVREMPGVNTKYYRDFVWSIWKIIFKYINEDNEHYVRLLYKLYIMGYSKGTKRSRSNFIIFAILLILNPIPRIKFPIEPLNKSQFSKIYTNSLKCNLLYKKFFQQNEFKKLL